MKRIRKWFLSLIMKTVGIPCAALLIRALVASLKVSVEGRDKVSDEQGQLIPGIYAIWHNRLFSLTGYFAGEEVCALISRSRDGQFIARVVERLGYAVVAGSSSRGGATALLEMIRLSSSLKKFVITVDGPRGPRYQVKEGAVMLAMKTGLPLIPLSCVEDRFWEFRSWDRFRIPKPFSRLCVRFEKPIVVDDKDFIDSNKLYIDNLEEILTAISV